MNVRMLRVGGVLAALSALTIVAVGGAASADTASKRATAKITMEKDGRNLFFAGPESVEKGAKLKVENLTSPRKVGPHTFTLVKKGSLPSSRNEFKKCARFELPVCTKVLKAHEVDPETGEVGKAKVENGRKGWDAAFSRARKGDSWYTERKNDTDSRKVSANAGKTLRFFCVVHPDMQGKIKVEG
jgi:hypothetical protein